MIAFYYGLTGFACAVYYRTSCASTKNLLLIGRRAAPSAGWSLAAALVESIYDLAKPENSESGDSWLGLGPPLVIGVGLMLFGVVLMVLQYRSDPVFFLRKREKVPHEIACAGRSTRWTRRRPRCRRRSGTSGRMAPPYETPMRPRFSAIASIMPSYASANASTPSRSSSARDLGEVDAGVGQAGHGAARASSTSSWMRPGAGRRASRNASSVASGTVLTVCRADQRVDVERRRVRPGSSCCVDAHSGRCTLRAGGRQPLPARAGEDLLEDVDVGQLRVRDRRLAAQRRALRQQLVDLRVDARDEEARHRGDVARRALAGVHALLEACDVGLGDLAVALDAEEQRHVD